MSRRLSKREYAREMHGGVLRDEIVALGRADWPAAVPNPAFVKCASCPRTGGFREMCGDCNVLPSDKRYWIRPNEEKGKSCQL